MISVAAAIHSYVEMASPSAKPEPDMPIKCSARNIGSDQGSNRWPTRSVRLSARKKSLESVVVDFFYDRYNIHKSKQQ